MKQSNNLLKYRYHFFRGKLAQPFFWAVVFLGPVLNLFRVDMLQQRLVFLEKSYSFEFKSILWLPIGFYGAVILIGIVSLIWGRLFCGWACPHNTLTEWTQTLRAMVGRGQKPPWMKKIIRKHPLSKELFALASPPLAIGLTFILSVLLSFYVVPPVWGFHQYLSGHPHPALVCGNILFVLIGLFLLYAGHDFCRTCCPYGMGQSISAYQESSRWRPMEIRFNGDKTDDCKTCQACQMVCPVDIDPRDATLTGVVKVGQFDGCFNCGECIDACKHLHSFKKAPGLLAFNTPGLRPKTPEAPILAETLFPVKNL
jgi:polyferredoxin